MGSDKALIIGAIFVGGYLVLKAKEDIEGIIPSFPAFSALPTIIYPPEIHIGATDEDIRRMAEDIFQEREEGLRQFWERKYAPGTAPPEKPMQHDTEGLAAEGGETFDYTTWYAEMKRREMIRHDIESREDAEAEAAASSINWDWPIDTLEKIHELLFKKNKGDSGVASSRDTEDATYSPSPTPSSPSGSIKTTQKLKMSIGISRPMTTQELSFDAKQRARREANRARIQREKGIYGN